MTEINQAQIDFLQKNLRELINIGPVLRDYCCKSRQVVARDAISEAVGHLMIAEAKVGQLMIKTPEGVIATRDGGGGGAGGK